MYLSALISAMLSLFLFNINNVHVFMAIFIEIICKLMIWIDNLELELQDDYSSKGILISCKKLYQAITMAAEALSWPIFYLLFLSLVNVILIVYRALSFCFAQFEMTGPTYFLVLGYIAIGIWILHVVIFMNLLSQQFQDKLVKFRQALEATHFHDAQEEKTLLTKRFKEFPGFDGNGYFHLSKSLLTATMANFVTYLIVLIQFRISETPTSQ